MSLNAIRKFIKLESSGGIILFAATLIALTLSNSSLSAQYHQFFHTPISLKWSHFKFEKTFSWWINDGLMVFFFLMVCLEIKWEMFKGELSSTSSKILPLIAALGGMLFPAFIYMLINWKNPDAHPGWAIPTATDIAFSLGIFVLLGKRIPITLKILLSAIAIFDDLGAIIIIALFYTHQLSVGALSLAAVSLVILYGLNRKKVVMIAPYMVTGFFLWIFLLKSGIHPTLAGVATAFAIPLESSRHYPSSLAIRLSNKFHPWVAFLILPLFALANAGVSFISEITLNDSVSPLALGIASGLFLGKQLGIFSAIFLAIKCKLCTLPKNVDWPSIYGMSLICGIGFTMSLFIGSLAFEESQPAYEPIVRWGVMLGSFASGLSGYLFLYFNRRPSADSYRI